MKAIALVQAVIISMLIFYMGQNSNDAKYSDIIGVLGKNLPVLLALAEARAEPQAVGAVTGVLLLFGNLGGIVLSLIVQLLLSNRIAAIGVLAAITMIILPFSLRLQTPAMFSQREAEYSSEPHMNSVINESS